MAPVDLTRRSLLGRAAAASAAMMAGSLLAPGVVFAGDDGEIVFETTVPRGGGPIETKRTFELLGIRRTRADLEVRTRGLDGRWSDWIPVHPAHDHGPDRPTAGSRADLSDPVWTGPANALELRSKRPLGATRIVLVDSGRGASAAAARYVDAGLPAAAGQPAVIARSSWASTACRPRVPAAFGAVDLAFVHHTVSSNAYAPSQSARMVRSICLFHKYGNGWNDIGYNFVVDRYGQIFEARAGGIDQAIVGAQAGGYNVYSTGVALLGDYGGHGPSHKTFDALSRLLAWKLAVHGVDVPGSVTVKVTRSGAPYSRYRAGAHVPLNRIAGHRDADTTSCPGAGMYRQLPRLRQVVHNLAGSISTLGMQIQGAAPGFVTVGGLLSSAGLPIAGATVEVQRGSTTRGPATLGTATTDANGGWAATVALAENAVLRAVFRGDPAHAAVVSPVLAAAVPPQIALAAAAPQTTPGGLIQFTGSVTPAKPRLTIVIAIQQPDGSFTTTRSIRVRTAGDGTFTRTIGFPDPGQYQVIAHTDTDEKNAVGTSAPVAITVA